MPPLGLKGRGTHQDQSLERERMPDSRRSPAGGNQKRDTLTSLPSSPSYQGLPLNQQCHPEGRAMEPGYDALYVCVPPNPNVRALTCSIMLLKDETFGRYSGLDEFIRVEPPR